MSYQDFSSIPGYNRFRFTANTVDRSDLIALAVKMPRDFRFWFIGAFSVMLDIDAWASANGVSADTMVEIANNDVIFGEFCEFVVDCVQNNIETRNAIQNIVSGGASANTIINNTNYSNTVLIAQNADANGCNDDARYGRIEALVDYIDTVQLDFFESIDAATNVIGEVANLISAIPIFETLPFDEAIATIGDTGEQWEDSYTASINTQLKEDFICDLWCELGDCSVTISDVKELILSKYNASSTQGLLNVFTAVSIISRIATTVATAGGLTYIGDDFVFLSWLLQILAVEASGEFFGVQIGDYVAQASNGTPSGLWSGCVCGTWTYNLVEPGRDGDFVVMDEIPGAEGFWNGVSWESTQDGNGNEVLSIRRQLVIPRVTSARFVGEFGAPKGTAFRGIEINGNLTPLPSGAGAFDVTINVSPQITDIIVKLHSRSTTQKNFLTLVELHGVGTNPFP